jgi:hypothetical protein
MNHADLSSATVGLHIVQDRSDGLPFIVTIDAAPQRLGLAGLTRPGTVNCILTHDAGLTWPDKKGEAMARAVVQERGVVALCFATLADAMGCQRRVKEHGL